MLKKVQSSSQCEKDKIAYGSLPLLEKLNYVTQHFIMSKFGFLSDEIKIGLKYAFDSGVTLDYVYKNQASGMTFIGKK